MTRLVMGFPVGARHAVPPHQPKPPMFSELRFLTIRTANLF